VRSRAAPAIFAVAVVVAVALAATGCTGRGSPSPSAGPSASASQPGASLANYKSPPLSFRYPKAWSTRAFHDSPQSSFSTTFLFIANQRMHDPCTKITSGGGSSKCQGWPVDGLHAGGVLAKWSSNGFPSWDFSRVQGPSFSVDGRPAKLVADQEACGRLGADQEFSVIVPTIPDDWWELDACFRDPGAQANAQTVMALLQTVHFHGLGGT